MIIADFPNSGSQLGAQLDVKCEIVARNRPASFAAHNIKIKAANMWITPAGGYNNVC